MLQNIIQLVKTEYKKFSKNSVVIVLLGTFTIFAPLLILGFKRLFRYSQPPFPSSLSLMELPMIWDYNAYINQHLIYVLLGYFVIYTITSEVANKTQRQNIITGYTKKEYFLAKLASFVAISLAATLLYMVSTALLGALHTDGASFGLMIDNNFLGIRYFLCCMGFMSFAMFIAFWFRRAGIAIFAYFGAIVMLEQMLRGFGVWVFTKIADLLSISYTPTQLFSASRWTPLNIFEDLLPNPFYKISGFIKVPDTQESLDLLVNPTSTIIVSVLYISLFIWLAWRKFDKKDI